MVHFRHFLWKWRMPLIGSMGTSLNLLQWITLSACSINQRTSTPNTILLTIISSWCTQRRNQTKREWVWTLLRSKWKEERFSKLYFLLWKHYRTSILLLTRSLRLSILLPPSLLSSWELSCFRLFLALIWNHCFPHSMLWIILWITFRTWTVLFIRYLSPVLCLLCLFRLPFLYSINCCIMYYVNIHVQSSIVLC